jgi:hypothetical protein
MSEKRCMQIGSAAVLAAIVMGGLASAQPRPSGPPAIAPAVPHGPPTVLAAGTTLHYGSTNTTPNDLGPRHWSGYYGWNGHPTYMWQEYRSDYSYHPYDRSYSYSDSYDYYHLYDADHYRRHLRASHK